MIPGEIVGAVPPPPPPSRRPTLHNAPATAPERLYEMLAGEENDTGSSYDHSYSYIDGGHEENGEGMYADPDPLLLQDKDAFPSSFGSGGSDSAMHAKMHDLEDELDFTAGDAYEAPLKLQRHVLNQHPLARATADLPCIFTADPP
jgi:hypothetical protein